MTAANGVDPKQPQTTLQLPTADVVSVVQDTWALTKRQTNVFLVVDTPARCRAPSWINMQAALRTFLAQIPSDQERVGLVEFNTGVANIIELDTLANNRAALNQNIDGMQANGNTALFDAVATAYNRLQTARRSRTHQRDRGHDRRPGERLADHRRASWSARSGRATRQVPVMIFCIAYGSDADHDMLGSARRCQRWPGAGRDTGNDPESVQDPVKYF